ncbi:hypothetical protein CL634_09835, partial [bacterium]|nr:hypothetical protein [bacterium]
EADFMEKHDKLTKRKKSHTGKGIESSPPRKKSKRDSNTSKCDQIQQELKDQGINDPGEWRKAYDFEDMEDGFEGASYNFDKLYTYLEGDKRVSDKEKIKTFSETEDSIERLELLRTMSLGDAVKCLQEHGDNPGQYRYLANRLDFYQKLFQGKATKRYTTEEYDNKAGQYIEVTKEEPIDASDVTPETIRLGVLRDMMFAGMIGTPELAVYKIADKRLQASGTSRTHMPELKGYHSYIHEGSIGYAYPFLRDIYQKSRKIIDKKFEGQNIDEEKIEHKAVIQAANWLEEAMDYNDSGRGPESPYVSSLEESVAWARLGDGVKRQLRGMRQKIQGVDLHNIERFIGKSGESKYNPERKKLYWQINNFDKIVAGDDDVFQQPHLQEYAYKENDLNNALEKKEITQEEYDSKKQELDKWFAEDKINFLEEENSNAIAKQEKWLQKETERLQHKLEKQLQEIEEAKLPEEERQLQIESVKAKHENRISAINADYQEHVDYYQKRTAEQLLNDLQERQALVAQRHEKRKSLAQKALDLHWMEGTSRDEYDESGVYNPVDWINYAPLGTIKRCHRMMRDGTSQEQIIKYALAEIICGKRGISRNDLEQITKVYDSANKGGWEEKQQLEAMMKVGNILSLSGYEASMDDIAQMSKQQFYGMTPALKEYNLEEVKEFMNKGLDLNSVVQVKKVTEKFGHELDNNVITEMASHNIEGLEDALRSFDLEDVKTFLSQDVNLPVAVSVLNNTKQFGYELKITQIANIAKNVHDIEDFTSALRGLPLAEVERLFSVGISYRDFNTVKGTLEMHKQKSDFTSSLAMAQKLSRHDEYGNLGNALEVYTIKEVDKIIASGATLSNVIDVKNSLAEKEVKSTLEETIQFTKLAGDWSQGWNVQKAIDTFGIDDVRKIASKNCRLDKAVEVNGYINNESSSNVSEELRESLKKGGLDVVIAIAKAGNMEVAVKTIEAGFTIEEITKFPFLISSLVTKK